MPFGRKSPLEALALPGVILAYKYSQFRQRRREAASRRVTERELSALHHKIDKLLNKLEESEPEPPTSQEDECVICINARATMQTSPCGHRVVCRRCFVKTIQSAVAQRLLPLRCVICRARVNRLTSSSGSWRIQESASSYSVGAKSWSSAGMPPSASSYSMGDQGAAGHHFPLSNGNHHRRRSSSRVAQSSSLYSMSSGTSSLSSASSNVTSCSNTSSASSGVDSSIASTSSAASSAHYPHRMLNNHHHNHATCPSGCSGAIPRKPSINGYPSNTNTYPGRRSTKGRIAELHNRLPPIKEFRSPAKVPHPSPVHISNPRFRYSSYTKTSSPPEMTPLLKDVSPPRKPLISPTTQKSSKQSSILSLSAKISPIGQKNVIQKNGLLPPPKTNGVANNNGKSLAVKKAVDVNSNHHNSSSSSKHFPLFTGSNIKMNSNKLNSNSNNTSRNLHLEEKADNKKNECVERKKEEKMKIKAEKEARKEEKRLAKEEERIARILAKEEKKKGKKEAKELLLANDGNKK